MTTHPVQVRFVGAGDAFGSGGRFQTCILLHAPGLDSGDVLLDCGASSLVALKQQGHDPNQIGLVLVSHLHGDHFGGLPFLILDGQFAHRTRPLHIAGPAGVGERVQAAMRCCFPAPPRCGDASSCTSTSSPTGSRSGSASYVLS